MLRVQGELFDFILREWLMTASASGLVLTSLYVQHLPVYSRQEIEVIYFLFILFVTVKGIENSGLLLRASQSLESGKGIPLKLLVITFFLSMIVTNDAALLVMVPLTLTLKIERMDILVILEALAANAGSALTPFGNPQNLFIYWFYQISLTDFTAAIAPFSMPLLILLMFSSLAVKFQGNHCLPIQTAKTGISGYIYAVLLITVILAILRLLPFWVGITVIIYTLLFDRRNLRVDYALLLTFLFFFGLAENIKILLAPELRSSSHIFLLSALASQFMSNVPAALLLAKVTTHWQALLWGTNVGGFGSLFGSLANLIAYRLYIKHQTGSNAVIFTTKFLLIGYGAFFIGVSLFFTLH